MNERGVRRGDVGSQRNLTSPSLSSTSETGLPPISRNEPEGTSPFLRSLRVDLAPEG